MFKSICIVIKYDYVSLSFRNLFFHRNFSSKRQKQKFHDKFSVKKTKMFNSNV